MRAILMFHYCGGHFCRKYLFLSEIGNKQENKYTKKRVKHTGLSDVLTSHCWNNFDNILILNYQKPHKSISKDTQAKWLRDVLNRVGGWHWKIWCAQYSCNQHISSVVLRCACGRLTTSCRVELRINVHPVLQEGTSRKYGQALLDS